LKQTEKAKYKFMSCHQNAGQNYNVNIGIISFENVANFKYLGMTVTNKNSINEVIKRLNSENTFYRSVQNFCLRINSLKI